MIERSEIDANAMEFKSKAHVIRVLKSGDKTLFCANDILNACGIKAAGKWLERNAYHRPDMVFTKHIYPVRAGNAYRRMEMIFVMAAVGKKLVKSTCCHEETKKWLTEEVFSYRADAESGSSDALDEQRAKWREWADTLRRNYEGNGSYGGVETRQQAEDLSKRIDDILLELLEIKWCVMSAKHSSD